ncbi:DUF1540 domain-containing protein [Streptomyces stackebrandtii]|uniref:DUF1540 domain-containing protein n=1 Tax=Streptomyces stackebrandtii TaxID=3051177 RepID=UPI0028DD016B|nr:DUF1540 domain-containing protein [Streptomyces sp. DSM 40976]
MITHQPVSLQVAGHAACPVVVVDHLPLGGNRIAVGAPHTAAALEFAFEAAAPRKTGLQAVHAWSLPSPSEPDPDPDEVAHKHQQELEEQPAQLHERYPDAEVTEDPVHDAAVTALTRGIGTGRPVAIVSPHPSPPPGGAPGATGHVGACKAAECRHNRQLECHAPAITVGYQENNVDCLTYAPA